MAPVAGWYVYAERQVKEELLKFRPINVYRNMIDFFFDWFRGEPDLSLTSAILEATMSLPGRSHDGRTSVVRLQLPVEPGHEAAPYTIVESWSFEEYLPIFRWRYNSALREHYSRITGHQS